MSPGQEDVSAENGEVSLNASMRCDGEPDLVPVGYRCSVLWRRICPEKPRFWRWNKDEFAREVN